MLLYVLGTFNENGQSGELKFKYCNVVYYCVSVLGYVYVRTCYLYCCMHALYCITIIKVVKTLFIPCHF